MGKINTPHDRFFRTSLSNRKVAKEFFLQHLPKGIQKMINLDSLQFKNETFVDSELKKQETDILFSADFEGENGYIYLLIEHESSVERLMPLRLLKYMISIMEDHIKKTKEKVLPLIYPIIFYTGKKPYYASTCLFDLFGQHKALAKKVLMESYRLVNVNTLSDEKLSRFLLSGLMAKAMKHSRDEDLFPFIVINIKDFQALAKQDEKAYTDAVMFYLFDVGEIKDKEKLFTFLENNLSEELGDNVMTIAQQLREEGRQQALQETRTVAQQLRDEGHLIGLSEGEARGKARAFQEITAFFQQGLSAEQILERIASQMKETKEDNE